MVCVVMVWCTLPSMVHGLGYCDYPDGSVDLSDCVVDVCSTGSHNWLDLESVCMFAVDCLEAFLHKV